MNQINEFNFKYNKKLEGYVIDDVLFNGEVLNIPSQHNGKPIVRINSIKDYFHTIKEIIIPNTILEIANNCFQYCSLIKYISIPNNVVKIGKKAFADCLALQRIILPNTIKAIEDGLFDECVSLTDISIPSSVNKIGSRVFKNCKVLAEINIPNSVEYIGSYAFYNCENLESIILPKSISEICFSSFENCSSLKKIDIPDGVVKIGNYSFSNCSNLEEVTIPLSVQKIGFEAFTNCNNLKKFYLFNKELYRETIGVNPNIIIYNIVDDYKNNNIDYAKYNLDLINNMKTNKLDKFKFLDKNVDINVDLSGKKVFEYFDALGILNNDDYYNFNCLDLNNNDYKKELSNFHLNVINHVDFKYYEIFKEYTPINVEKKFSEFTLGDDLDLNYDLHPLIYHDKRIFNWSDDSVKKGHKKYIGSWKLSYVANTSLSCEDSETIYIFDCENCTYQFLQELGIDGIYYIFNSKLYMIYFDALD